MTVENTVPYEKYITNGSDSVYTLSYYVEDKDHLFIKLDDTVVSKNEYSYIQSSNSVQFNTILPANQKLEIFRKTELERTTNYESYNNTFRPEVLNKDLDKIWLNLQEQNFKVNQYDHDYEYAVHTSTQALTEVVAAQTRADDAYELADTTNTEIRPIERGGTGANTVEEARSNLEIYSQTETDSLLNTKLTANNNLSDLQDTATARSNLDVHNKAEVLALIQTGGSGSIVSIEGGGTGATTAEEARTNLNVYSKEEALNEIKNRPSLPIGHTHIRGVARSHVPDGEIPLDGYTYNRADYPDLWKFAQATGLMITDAEWLANPLKRVCYSSGNGSTTFRTPDYNGIQLNSLKSLVMRGDGYAASGTALGDAIRDHNHILWTGRNDNSGYHASGTARGHVGYGFTANEDAGDTWVRSVSGVDVADENRPVSGFGIWVIVAKGKTESLPSIGQYPTLTGGNTWNGSQAITGDLSVSGKAVLNGVQHLTRSKWVDVKGTRLFATKYLNNTGYEREVNVWSELGNNWLPTLKVTFTDIATNVDTVVYFGCSSNWSGGIYCAERFIVPPYTAYKAELIRADSVTTIVTLAVRYWWERDYYA